MGFFLGYLALYIDFFLSLQVQFKSIIRKTKCSRIFKRSASFSKTKRNFSKLSPIPQKSQKNRPASPELYTFEGS